ncbi:Usherin [Biomphalaria pfeifferi]|nr:Usherin [Biomphalaria pfeifferi]
MTCNWSKSDYFVQLLDKNQLSNYAALEMLVDDLHTDKEHTISTFLSHSGSEDLLWALVQLLGNKTHRVAGNAAYILGTLAESDLGCHRILYLAKGRHKESKKILSDLTHMLTFDDPESVMNAAGTLGTLAESSEGREWMLSEPCLEDMLDHVTNLLHVDNLWTASNAALVIARMCISELGCAHILKHRNSQNILTKLIQVLGVDEAGRGMNAAFAIGRLCDMDKGRERLMALTECEKMISSLAKMLCCEDAGASKNACFALSCLATSLDGHARLLGNAYSEQILRTLSQLLSAPDTETGWFAAMTLRTLASQPKGCQRLRASTHVCAALNKVHQLTEVSQDLKEEVLITLEILKPLDPPDPPTVTVLGPTLCDVSWSPVTTKSGFDVQYQLYEGNHCCYRGNNCQFEVNSLTPNTAYTFKVKAITEVDESSFSESVPVTTEEDIPEAPQNLRVNGTTATQLKLAWDPPEKLNGISKGYYVYIGKSMIEHTSEHSVIISGLASNTSFDIEVCAATFKGKGPRASCTGNTSEMGAHCPGKPNIQVLGRNEMHITWDPPEVPMGRITRYDVVSNGKVIYSGTDLSFSARRLTPDTEYTFTIIALTSEGKFESKSVKKRTTKDEYEVTRTPLYQPPKKEEELPKPVVKKKRKSVGDAKSARLRSAKTANPVSADMPETAAVSEKPPLPKNEPLQKPKTPKHDAVRPRTYKDSTQTPKPVTPITLSFISIQGPGSNFSDSPNKGLHRSKTFYEQSQPVFQLQRSKTTIIPNKPFTKKIISRKKDGDGRASGEPLNRDLTLASDMAPEVTGSHSLSSGPQEDITELSMLLPTQDTSILEIPDLDRRLSAASDVSIVSRPVNDVTSYSAPVSEMKTSDTDNNDMRQRPTESTVQESNDLILTEVQPLFQHRTTSFINSSNRNVKQKIDVNSVPLNIVETSTLLKKSPSYPTTKFVSTQIRSPSNKVLSNALHRMSTTVSQSSPGNLLSRRYKNMSRSLTQINIRSRPTGNMSNQMLAQKFTNRNNFYIDNNFFS